MQRVCSGDEICTPALCAFREKAVNLLFLERDAFRHYRENHPQVCGALGPFFQRGITCAVVATYQLGPTAVITFVDVGVMLLECTRFHSVCFYSSRAPCFSQDHAFRRRASRNLG